MWWLWSCAPEEPVTLTVELEVRPGLHDLVAVVNVPPEQVSWSWALDGLPVPATGYRIPVRDIAPGQQWSVTVRWEGQSASASASVPEPPGGNVLVVILDDIGVDKLAVYGLNDQAPPTPTLDALAAEGVVFRRAYGSPTCTPTRAELLTGRHGRRLGAGWLVSVAEDDWELGLDAILAPEALRASRTASWSDSFLGKWHLAGRGSETVLQHPLLSGFSSFAGTVGYLVQTTELDGYFLWKKNTEGVEALSSVYNTTDTVNDAIERLSTLPEPFVLWVSFNAAHVPLHRPPDELHTRVLPAGATDQEHFAAMVEAMDTELGRLLGAMSPLMRERTTVIVVGDNGTTDFVLDPGFDSSRSKHTVYEGGIRVPLIVAGPHVAAPGRSDALVHVVDVFTTLMEIGGVPLTDVGSRVALDLPALPEPRVLDGLSLLPYLQDPAAPGQRSVLFAQQLQPNGPPPWSFEEYVVLDGDFKLIRRQDGQEELFVLPGPDGLDEGPDLLSPPLNLVQGALRERLGAELDRLLEEMPYEGF
jgi:arylsulfatase A-like enzyme